MILLGLRWPLLLGGRITPGRKNLTFGEKRRRIFGTKSTVFVSSVQMVSPVFAGLCNPQFIV